MKISQQIVGVNQRLGNSAVQNMQGTTRMIFDTVDIPAGVNNSGTSTFFQGVSSRVYPKANLASNRFEPGESLAIQGFSVFTYSTSDPDLAKSITSQTNFRGGILNFFIGNQRVCKDLEIVTYNRFGIGESINMDTESAVFRLETPIIIPPQIEFYATLRWGSAASLGSTSIVLAAYGTGTLLNTKSNY
jgi:hypothetical protein